MSKISLFFQKIKQNFTYDFFWLRSPQIKFKSKLTYLISKYFNLMAAKKRIVYLGKIFHYDNYWTPSLLQVYPIEIATLIRHIDKSKVINVLDVGANIGQFASTWLHFSPSSKLFSFEPNNYIYPLLAKNSQGDYRWATFPFALGEHEQKTDFYFVPLKSAQGSFFPSNATKNLLKTSATKTTVDVVKLNQQTCSRLGIPKSYDLIKIDVEGSELTVLRSLAEISWRYLYIECSLARDGAIPEDTLWRILSDLTGQAPRLIFRKQPTHQSITFDLLLENTNFKSYFF